MPGFNFGLEQFPLDPRWQWAAGGLAADVRDLARWGLALLEGDAVTEAQRELMTTRAPWPEHGTGEPAPYGYGLRLGETPCGPVIGHTGSTMGFQSDLFRTDDGITVAVLHNDFGYEASELAWAACGAVQAALAD